MKTDERPTIPAMRYTADTMRMKRIELDILLAICAKEKEKEQGK